MGAGKLKIVVSPESDEDKIEAPDEEGSWM
jgi:hypothetical protein